MNILESKNLENLSLDEIKQEYKKNKQTIILKNIIFVLVIIFLAFVFMLSNIVATSNSKFAQQIGKNSFIKQISNLISADTKKLQGEKDGRTNVLIMGMGGEGHDGPYLTDTIILVSYDYAKNETSMVSIPRDMVVKTDNGMYKKVNSLYTIGESIKKGYGMQYEKEIIEKNIGIPIHYAITIDFYGFKEIVDALGGVDVDVENSFVDNEYPTYDHKVQTIKFTKGYEHMSGERALEFARSRHGYSLDGKSMEGNDFARSKRQFKVINAIKDKILSFSTITNPTKVAKLFKILNKYIKTDVETWEALRFVDVLKDIQKDKIFTKTLSDAPGNLLQGTTSTYDGAYVLIPKDYNYGSIQNFFVNIFGDTIQTQQLQNENPVIEILNGTNINGLATKKSDKLAKIGLKVRRISNAINRNVSTTIIYDLSKNQKPQTLSKIQEVIYGVRSSKLPDEEKYDISDDVDFVIILGNDLK